MKKLFEQLTTPEVMAEVLALLMAALLATALAHYIKNWLRPLADARRPATLATAIRGRRHGAGAIAPRRCC